MSDIDVDELLLLDRPGRREWLLDHQPGEESERPNWWLSLIQPLGFRVTTTEPDPAARLRWAALSVELLDLALESGALSAREVANRLGWLSVAVHEIGAPAEVPPDLAADVVARRSLALIDVYREDAPRLAERWRERPIEDIRRLRDAKNLLSPLAHLSDRIDDDELRADVRGWLAIRSQLP